MTTPIINISEVLSYRLGKLSGRASRIFALACDNTIYATDDKYPDRQKVIGQIDADHNMQKIPLPEDVVQSCIEWVSRVNTLSYVRLRMLAIANIMSGHLYTCDKLTDEACEELSHFSSVIDRIDIKEFSGIVNTPIEIEAWDNPAITTDELVAMVAYIPITTRAFYEYVVTPYIYNLNTHTH